MRRIRGWRVGSETRVLNSRFQSETRVPNNHLQSEMRVPNRRVQSLEALRVWELWSVRQEFPGRVLLATGTPQ